MSAGVHRRMVIRSNLVPNLLGKSITSSSCLCVLHSRIVNSNLISIHTVYHSTLLIIHSSIQILLLDNSLSNTCTSPCIVYPPPTVCHPASLYCSSVHTLPLQCICNLSPYNISANMKYPHSTWTTIRSYISISFYCLLSSSRPLRTIWHLLPHSFIYSFFTTTSFLIHLIRDDSTYTILLV